MKVKKISVAGLIGVIGLMAVEAKGLEAPYPFYFKSETPHKTLIYDHGLGSLDKRLKMVEEAVESIELEYFIYDRDPSARVFTQALVRAAKRGVKVRMLLDTFMVAGEIDGFVVQSLQEAGVEVKYYNPANILRLIKYQYRNHRKLLAVDNQKIIIGGRNLADEYFDMKEDFNFIDKDVYMEGPVAKAMVDSFDIYWNHKLSEKPKTPKKPSRYDIKFRERDFDLLGQYGDAVESDKIVGHKYKELTRSLNKYEKNVLIAKDFIREKEVDRELLRSLADFNSDHGDLSVEGTCEKVTYVTDEPGWGRKSWKKKYTRDLVLEKFNKSTETVLLDSPYFIPDSDTNKALEGLTKRKVDLHIMTNSLYSTDAIYVNAVFNSVIGKWLKKEVPTWIFKGDALPVDTYPLLDEKIQKSRWGTHTKAFVFDHDFFIGSYNFDPRSNRYSAEMGVVCEGAQNLYAEMARFYHAKKDSSFFIKEKKDLVKVKFDRISAGKKVLYYILKPLSLLLRNLL
jgi:putative cardiolipin synthase